MTAVSAVTAVTAGTNLLQQTQRFGAGIRYSRCLNDRRSMSIMSISCVTAVSAVTAVTAASNLLQQTQRFGAGNRYSLGVVDA